jgi:hypothetical protein
MPSASPLLTRRMNIVFWSVAALDALLFLVMLVKTLQSSSGSNDGGKEMALFFFIMLPSAVLLLAVLLYAFTAGIVWRSLALLVVAGPGLFIGWGQARNVYIDHRIAQHASGAGYFSGREMKAMGAAVVKRDVQTLRELGPSVHVNIEGEGGMTLLALAAQQADADDPGAASVLPVVEVLLSLGAKPAQAMETATKLKDLALLRLLLDAGGDPNMKARDGQPLVFSWLAVMPLPTLRLLAERGLDLNATSYQDPLAVVLAIKQRRDLLAFLIEQGADMARPRPDGRNAPGEVDAQIDEALKAGQPVPPELLQIKAMMDARKEPRHDHRA